MKLSVVATLYQSAPYIIEFYERASSSARELVGDDYEIVLVNDGSQDNSLDLAVELSDKDEHVVVVDLSRNFGHHKAMMTGLSYARGELVFLIDSDLEEEPEWLISFCDQMEQELCDVVFGIQEHRKGSWSERWFGKLFYKIFNMLTDLELPADIVTARLMSRRYVDALLLHKERELFIAGIWHITGFHQSSKLVAKNSISSTTYTFGKKISLLINSVTSFSNAPLINIFYFGIFISFVSFMYTAYMVVNWYFFEAPMDGWTSIMASIWLLGGMIISFIGVVGIYLSKIYMESKRRPYTIVRQIYASKR